MGLLEKTEEASYSPLGSERSASSSDDLLYDGHFSGLGKPKASRRTRVAYFLGALALFLAYSGLLVTTTSMWWKRERIHGANVIDSKLDQCAALTVWQMLTASPAPIRKYIEYEPKIFHMTETSKDYPLVGQPSDELDARWSNLMQYFYAQIPASYMKKLGREKTGIKLENGNYLANFAWVHQVSTSTPFALLSQDTVG
jgi:hypothetical protein